jgi:mannose-6-phosphate isomerase-like protein (cupin superfamily)
MLVTRLADCREIIANDGCRLRELLNPEHDGSGLSYSLALAWVDPGQATHPHRLAHHEVYLILRGSGVMHIEDEVRTVAPGDAVVIPPRARQWIENRSNEVLEFAALVSPPWRAQDDQRA